MTQMHLIAIGVIGMILNAAGWQLHQPPSKEAAVGKDDLVLMHIPFNFGHTIELAHAIPPNLQNSLLTAHSISSGSHGFNGAAGVSVDGITEDSARLLTSIIKISKPNYEPWGHWNADLFQISEVSGQPLYFTPPKYWPQDVAARYFGNKTIFGVLRDPYERLVAEFRGNDATYGGINEFFATCDVNSAVKEMMKEALNSTNPFVKNCAYLPQAEYFDGPYGIQLAVDNRRFPTSMNEVFEAHGYTDYIGTESILHVDGCNDVWAGDLDAETRQMVRQVYARDFELLCKHFGYCDAEANTCLQEVPQMCPPKLFTWNHNLARYFPKV